MNARTLPGETVVLELEPWEARRLVMALNRIKRSKTTVGKAEFAMSEKVVMKRIIETLGES